MTSARNALTAIGVLTLTAAAFAVPARAANTTVSTWAELKTAVAAAGTNTVLLGADVVGSNDNLALADGADLTLDLNGHALTISARTAPNSSSAAQAGIVVPSGSTLRIEATGGGSLTATGGKGWTNPLNSGSNGGGGAGIGGNGGQSAGGILATACGSVVINAGTLRLTGGNGGMLAGAIRAGGAGAGIGGGGGSGSGSSPSRGAGCTVTVTGGDIVATGGSEPIGVGGGGAGIGSGGGSAQSTLPGNPGTWSLAGGGTPSSGGAGSAGVLPPPQNGGAAGVAATASVVASAGRFFTSVATAGATTSAGGSVEIDYSFEVAFDTQDGSTVPALTVPYGGSVSEPVAPTLAGFIFGGWLAGSTTGASYLFGSVVTAPTTLFAVWTADPPPPPPSPTATANPTPTAEPTSEPTPDPEPTTEPAPTASPSATATPAPLVPSTPTVTVKRTEQRLAQTGNDSAWLAALGVSLIALSRLGWRSAGRRSGQ